MKKFINSTKNAMILAGSSMFAAAAAFAEPDPTAIETLFEEVDLAGVSDLVLSASVLIVGIAVVFVGVKLAKRVLSRV